MLDPETGVILFVIGGIGTVATFMGFKAAQDIGPKVEAKDMLPMPPPYPPVPRLLYNKELMESLRRRR